MKSWRDNEMILDFSVPLLYLKWVFQAKERYLWPAFGELNVTLNSDVFHLFNLY